MNLLQSYATTLILCMTATTTTTAEGPAAAHGWNFLQVNFLFATKSETILSQ